MSEEKLLTIREVSGLLGISEKDVMNLADSGAIPAYKIGGVYLRFKRQEIEAHRKKVRPQQHKESTKDRYTFGDRLSDFFYFNDFYILAFILIGLIITVILKD
ncbi:MAG: helix-turn-helix domain-containing protein [Candidatus Omnitrophica bacterium]|nr:helix-turn-helix domain-containing protein [Candidatus Omnitrophota bacterium]